MTFRLTTDNLDKVMAGAHQILEQMKVAMQHFQVLRVGSDFVVEFDAEVSHTQQRLIFGELCALEARCEVVPAGLQRE